MESSFAFFKNNFCTCIYFYHYHQVSENTAEVSKCVSEQFGHQSLAEELSLSPLKSV